MSLAFYEDKQTEEKQKKPDNRSVFSKVTDALFGGTKKLAGTVKAGAGGAYGIGKIAKASVFGDDKQYNDTVKGVDATLNKDLAPGKTFFKDRQEAQDLNTGGFFKKSIGAGTEVATEVLPFARGASVATKGLKAAEAIPKVLAEGAAYGAAGEAGSSLAENGNINPMDTFKSALTGAATGLAGFGVGKGIEKGVSNIKPVHAHFDETPNLSDAGTTAYHGSTNDKLTSLAPGAQTGLNEKRNLIYLTDDKAAATSYAKNRGTDGSGLGILTDSSTGKVYDVQVHGKVLGAYDSNELAKLKTANGFDGLSGKTRNQLTNPTGLSAAILEANPELTDFLRKNGVTAVKAHLPNGGGASELVVVNPDKIRMANKGAATQPSLIDVNTTHTAPTEARTVVAQSAKSMDIKPLQRAKTALTGEAPKTNATTPVGKGAESIAQKLDEQLTTFDKGFKAPQEIIDKLSGSDAVTRKARKNDWLNRYEDTLSVLGRHFGKVGTDFGYKLAEGAKKVSDIQEVVRPSIDKTKKLLDGMSKSKSGRSDIQSRVYSALEDRANAGQYIKNPKEQELYDEVVKVFDFFKGQREKSGKSVVAENYSPRAAVSNALDAPERLLNDARSAFSPDVKSRFSKQRVKQMDDAEINRNIIDLLPMYASSQSKEFGYEGAMKFATENFPNVNPAYLTDPRSRRQGEEYMRELLNQVLDPPTMSKSERVQNKLISNTYKATLGLNPRYALQNLSQRFITRSQVSGKAVKLAKDLDKVQVDQMRKQSIFGDATLTHETTNTADTLGAAKPKGLARLEPGAASERGNVHGAFDRGVAQEVVGSQPYKDAIKQGMKPRDAANAALQDPTVREAAIRRGNIVVNDTQFGANFVTKPEFFREAKSFFGLSDKWFKQYQRFPQGMIQNMSTILRANDARALDVLKRGNPAETNLVDFKYSAEALHNGVDDLIKGIKNGEIHDVSLEVAEGYQKTLKKAIAELDKGIKSHSQIRGGKTAKGALKMWAAASAIQWLFDGGFAMSGDQQGKEIVHAATYGSPISVPTRDQNPLAGATIPSSPFRPGLQPRRLLNFVPGVGVAVNRGREINKFVKALTGDSNQ